MKTIHIHSTKRFYSFAASASHSPKPKTKSQPVPVRPAPSPRSRRGSLSVSAAAASGAAARENVASSPNASRSLYTNASGPLHYFDAGAPPPPPPLPPPPSSSRPVNPNSVSPSRLTAGGEAQNAPANSNPASPSQAQSQSPHSPHSQSQSHSPQTQTSHSHSSQPQTQPAQQGQGHHGGQQAEGGTSQPVLGSTSLTFNLIAPATPPGSSPPDRSLLLQGPHASLAASTAWRGNGSGTADPAEKQDKGSDKEKGREAPGASGKRIYQLDVGAYGIPKRGRESGRAPGRRNPCACPACLEEEEIFALDELDDAVQVGEDAYFVREDALGVADGVGGWGARSAAARPTSNAHSCSSCAAASTSRHMQHPHYSHRPANRAHPAQPSPSALFARRLMHFCAREVGEARTAADAAAAAAAASLEQNVNLKETTPAATSKNNTMATPKPTLKHGGVAPRPSSPAFSYQRKVVTKERPWGNARPFTWPWEEAEATAAVENAASSYPEYAAGMEALLEEDGQEKMSAALGPDSSPAETRSDGAEGVSVEEGEVDPLEDTIDPVAVLERAYVHTLDAHRVRRHVRAVRTPIREGPAPAPWWWTYGVGLGAPSHMHSNLAPAAATPQNVEEVAREEWVPLRAGSSTALLAVLSGDRLRVAHLGDCVGWLVRAGEVVWRSEEMWWGFNYPLQLGPASPTRPCDARRYELRVQADDILILASDGMSDNLWEEDVLDEVRRFVAIHRPLAASDPVEASEENKGSRDGIRKEEVSLLGRRTLAGMLSEALCSRARGVSEQARGGRQCASATPSPEDVAKDVKDAEEVPFARRAREEGKSFRGGKCDDISVLVAVISPAAPAPAPASTPAPTSCAASALIPSQAQQSLPTPPVSPGPTSAPAQDPRPIAISSAA
ncbi:hypothetical protein DFH11DRAFT_590725 [Phellopilus nigrolimitatus]|nr:hypothetical protein DFH11DRAFT_590725 [Phellopilus nigrolimitatus]